MKNLFLLFFLSLTISVFSQNPDIRLLRSFNSPLSLPADGFFRVVSNSDMYVITGIPVTMGLVGLVKHDDDLLRKSYVVAGATVLNLGITAVLKYSIRRDRPFVTYPDIINKTGKPLKDPSFPSGHTSTAFTMATSLTLECPKWYVIVPAYTYAGTVGYSRMRLGAHYPSDVLMGAIIGTGSAWITHVVNKKLNIKHKCHGR